MGPQHAIALHSKKLTKNWVKDGARNKRTPGLASVGSGVGEGKKQQM